MKGKRRRGRLKKRWENNIKEWTGIDFASSTRAAENRDKMERDCCEFSCGDPTTFQGYGIEQNRIPLFEKFCCQRVGRKSI